MEGRGRSQGKRLIFLVQAGYSRWTQSPLQRKENTPKAKSWNIALQRAERVPRANAPQCALIISTAFHIQSPSDPLGPSISPASEGPDAISRQQRACLYAQRAQPRYSDYLPLFQRGSAPVSMTTWIPFCSVGLDIQSVAREGCRGATQQMHSSQQDALLLLSTAWKLVRQRRRWWWESPWVVFFLLFSSRLGLSFFFSLWQPVPPVSLATPPVVTYFSLL